MVLADAYKKTVEFLKGGGYNYIIIGGIAATAKGLE